MTKDEGCTRYMSIIDDLERNGAESDSFKEILKILEEYFP